MTKKRPSSPLPIYGSKKRALSSEVVQHGSIDSTSYEVLRTTVQKLTEKQVDLVEQLAFKDEECQKLKKKSEEVDCNCRRWHEFAISLQSRVKRLELILHRQQDSIKSLKKNSTTDVSVQTQSHEDLYGNENCPRKDEMLMENEVDSNSSDLVDHTQPSVVIDLTDDPVADNSKDIKTAKPASNDTICPGQNILRDSSSKLSAQVDSGSSNCSPTLTPQLRSVSVAPSSAHNTSTNVVSTIPYPPLLSMPLPPENLPKHILLRPFQPLLRIRKSQDGIELSWNHNSTLEHAKIDSYELYVYQHNPTAHGTSRWKKIGNEPIKAMPLPMACTLSQFSTTSKYFFAVRGKDVHGRYGTFSMPCCSSDA